MRTVLWVISALTVFAHGRASTRVDSVFVIISGDTVSVWNTGVQANCASRFGFIIESNDSGAFSITEVDTVGPKVYCNCIFDICVSLSGIDTAGTYHVDVRREYRKQYGYPSDATLFIGSTQFTIGPPGSASVSQLFYQSPCRDVVDVQERSVPPPAIFRLYESFPNPFNPRTTIKYELPKSSMVRLSVFDLLGREVSVLVNEKKDAGLCEVTFDGSGLASGVYFYRIEAGSFVEVRKLLLLQ
jgi:hypothetical protein